MNRGISLQVIFLELLPAALLCGLFATVGVIHVTSRVMVVKQGYRLSQLEQDAQALIRDQDSLKLELATLKSPGRLERAARDQLKMQPPGPGALINLGGR
jgi:cell division protein FtsL